MPGREAMIRKMESILGTEGRPNVVTEWYAERNGSQYLKAPWCNMTITWAASESGNRDAVCFGKDYAYTVAHALTFKDEGRWHTDVEGIKRGDIVFFDWSGTNNIAHIDHVGIVTDVNGRDVLTIEGNTANSCKRRVRQAAEIAGYGRPDYPAHRKPKPEPKPEYEPWPGYEWFNTTTNSPIYNEMGKRLVKEGCGLYSMGPGPFLTESDKRSYEKWQRKLGLEGPDATWPPGKWSWDKLKVPKK